MPEILCVTHRGIRCALLSKHVVDAARSNASLDCIALWQNDERPAVSGPERAIRIVTGQGIQWLSVSDATMVVLPASHVQRLPELLRRIVALAHVVGFTVLNDELVWLIDPRRYSPAHLEVPLTATL